MSAPSHPSLPPALDAVLDGFEDKLLGSRLRAVHRAASTAIESLSYLNLVKYEPTSAEEGSADLDMWERMAAPVAETVALVSTAQNAMRSHFPRAFDRPGAFDPQTEVSDWRASEEIESIIGAINRRLQYELDSVRNDLRRPEVISSRWRLLSELQEIRAGLRRQLGDLVFLTTNALTHAQREAIVPGRQNEVSRTAQLRRAIADLAHTVRDQGTGVGSEAPKMVDAVLKGLMTLAGESSWNMLSVEVKRSLIALRDELDEPKAKSLDVGALQAVFAPSLGRLEALLGQLTLSLDSHDREAWAQTSERLEQVQLHLDLGSTGGARIFSEALEVVESLYGRDARLDTWLISARALVERRLAEAELREELGRFKEQLSVLPFH